MDSNNKNPKIIVSLETKKSIDLAHRIVDYVDGFKINHLLSAKEIVSNSAGLVISIRDRT